MKKYILKKISKIIVILSTAVSCGALAENAYLYHCPSIKDFTFNKDTGDFSAHTNYNGLALNWFSIKNYYKKSVADISFFRAGTDNCTGETCDAVCVYKVDNEIAKGFFLDIQYNAYRILKVDAGQWKGDPRFQMCYANDPKKCTFYLVKNRIIF